MYYDFKDNWNFSPIMPGERRDITFTMKANVLEVGNTIIMTYSVNGQWFGMTEIFDDPLPLMTRWMQSPLIWEYVKELVNHGIWPSNVFVLLFSRKLQIKNADGILTIVPEGTKLLIRTASGIACGFGTVSGEGKLKFLAVYGNDSYRPGQEGANQGDELQIFMAVKGQPGEARLYTPQPIHFTQFGDRMELSVVALSPINFGRVITVAMPDESATQDN